MEYIQCGGVPRYGNPMHVGSGNIQGPYVLSYILEVNPVKYVVGFGYR